MPRVARDTQYLNAKERRRQAAIPPADLLRLEGFRMVEVPDCLTAVGADLWSEIGEDLARRGVLARRDLHALELLAGALAEVRTANARLADEGTYFTTKNTNGDMVMKAHPLVAQRSDAMRRATRLLVSFGLTPTDRDRVLERPQAGVVSLPPREPSC